MANTKNEKLLKELNLDDNRTSSAINGSTNELDLEDSSLQSIIRQTAQRTTQKFGQRTGGKTLSYFTEKGLAAMLADSVLDKKDNFKAKQNETPNQALKRYMTSDQLADKIAMINTDVTKLVNYKNYDAIYKHVPECATALKIYRDNILSPDDYTKNIFNYEYTEATDEKLENQVKEKIEDIIQKYDLEKKTSDIIGDALLYGDSYYAILSLNDELTTMLEDPSLKNNILQESIDMYDTSKTERIIDNNDIKELNESQMDAFKNFFNENKLDVKEDKYNNAIADIINNHFKIGSKLSLLQERAEYEYEKMQNSQVLTDIENFKSKKKNKKVDTKPLYLNGSALRRLSPENVIELKMDDIIYGYIYYEENEYNNQSDPSVAGDYLGTVTGKSQSNVVSMSSTGATLPTPGSQVDIHNSQMAMRQIISDVFLNAVSKKINKEYVRHNKQFKDFIYSLVKQNYIMTKEIKMTFFTPEEVVHFEVEPIYKNITFFAKIYLAMLTNMIVINMGRGHDKRIFYVQTGLDDQFEAAVTNTIESIKSKEFRLSETDINTVLNLNAGALDDWFIPTNASGEHPIEVDTLSGMDIDIANNNFLDWLRKSMMNGMHIPANLIDAMSDIDYARTLSAQNANFVRSVISYQMKFQKYFTKFIQRLYANEYKYADNAVSEEDERVIIDKIKISFPSPASLNMTNMQEQISVISSVADELSLILVPPRQDASNDDIRSKVKAEIFKQYFPAFDYDYYDEFINNEVKPADAKEKVKANFEQQEDPNAGMY